MHKVSTGRIILFTLISLFCLRIVMWYVGVLTDNKVLQGEQ